MDLQHFQQMIAAGEPLRGEEMIAFMREQSDNTHRLLFDLNNSYHTPEEIVALLAGLPTVRCTNHSACFLRFIRISERTYTWGKMSSSTLVVSFKTKEVYSSETVY